MPELVLEVRSRNDRWPKILAKVAESLDGGVSVVVILHEDHSSAHVLTSEQNQIVGPDDELTFSGLLPGFSIAVQPFLE